MVSLHPMDLLKAGLNSIIMVILVILISFMFFYLSLQMEDSSLITILFLLGLIVFFSGLIGLTQKLISDGISIGLTLASKPDSIHDSFEQMNLKDTLTSGFSYFLTILVLGGISSIFIIQGLGMQEFQCEGYPGDQTFSGDNSEIFYGDYVSFTIDSELVGDGINDCQYWFQGEYNDIYIDQLEPGILFTEEDYRNSENLDYTFMGYLSIMLGFMVLLCTLVGFTTKLIADTVGTGFELHNRGINNVNTKPSDLDGSSNLIRRTLDFFNIYEKRKLVIKSHKYQEAQSEILELQKEIRNLKNQDIKGTSTQELTAPPIPTGLISNDILDE